MSKNTEPSGSLNQLNHPENPRTNESPKTVDWSADDIIHHDFPETGELIKNNMREIINYGKNNGQQNWKRKTQTPLNIRRHLIWMR